MKKIVQHCLLFPIIILLAAAPSRTEGSSKKPKHDKTEPADHKMPSSLVKKLMVLSDLDEDVILQILKFIDDKTGLSCSFVPYGEPVGSFDVFIGSFFSPAPETVYPYSSDLWNDTKNGIVTWSRWQSCIVFNTILLEDSVFPEHNGEQKDAENKGHPADLTGKISAIDPLKDRYIASTLYTLYKKYGKQVLYHINGFIPLYMETRKELTAALKNGRYAGVFTIDGYAIPSLEAQYPLYIDYKAFDSDQFPVTTVMGSNTAFISTRTENPRAAQHFINFLANEQFRQFIGKKFFFTPPYTLQGSDYLTLTLEANWVQTFTKAWKNVAYPEGIDEDLLLKLR